MTTTLTVKDVAADFGTDPRTLRKFLRSQAKAAGGTIGVDTPGKGGRYSFEPKEVRAMKKAFATFKAAEAEARAERAAAKAAAAEMEAEEILEDEDLDDSVDDTEEDFEELDELDEV